jgi:hypothetical protein
MNIYTKFEPGSRVYSVAKAAGAWQAGPGTVTSITITVTTTGATISYLIDADTGPDVTRKENFVSFTLAEAQALAADLNA